MLEMQTDTRLAEAVRSADARQGSVIAVLGKAGISKTRLISDLRRQRNGVPRVDAATKASRFFPSEGRHSGPCTSVTAHLLPELADRGVELLQDTPDFLSLRPISGLGHGLPLWRRSQHFWCTPDSCRLAASRKSAASGHRYHPNTASAPLFQTRSADPASAITRSLRIDGCCLTAVPRSNRNSARHRPTSTSRGFPPWRLSDDGPGPRARGIVSDGAVIRNPSRGHGSVALLREEETNSREESYGKARLESRQVVPGFDRAARRPVYLRKGTIYL
jgi:hypothetical protein